MISNRILKPISIIITIVIIIQYLSVLAPIVQVRAETATVNEFDWNYELDSNGNAINVVPKDKSKISGDIVIPNELDGHIVTSIGERAFSFCENLKNIEIPSNVSCIKYYAFGWCRNLKSIKLTENITQIEDSVFYYCGKLESIEISSNLESIGYGVFYSCPAQIFVEKDSKGETTLKNRGYKYIYTDRINYKDNNEITWSFCYDNQKNAYRLKYKDGILKEKIEIPKELGGYTVKSIGDTDSIFGNNSNSVTNVIVNKEIELVEKNAFKDCCNLKTVTFLDRYTKISGDIFKNCNSNITLLCYGISEVASYAEENNIKYKNLINIEFNDKNLYNKIKSEMGEDKVIDSEDESCTLTFLREDIQNTKKLDISNSKIKDLKGIEFFNSLEELNISNNSINSTDNINGLINLKKLDLSNNNLNSIRIENLINIENLNLNHNSIESIDVSNMTKLNDLDLDYNKIRDISSIENANINNLKLQNQEFGDVTYKEENELPDIIKKAIDSKYTNGENVTYQTQNCEVSNDKLVIRDVPATVTVKGGIMNETKYTIDIDDLLSLEEHTINNDKLTLKFSKNYSTIEDADIYYAIDSGDYKKYDDFILLSNGTHNISVKLFNKELGNFDVETDVVINALRKNGKIYIFSNSFNTKKYSLTGENFIEYKEAIEESDSKTIFIKIGENEAKEITIKDIGIDDDYQVYDAMIGSNNINDDQKTIRKNGIVYLKYPRYSNTTYYSFDRENWTSFNKYAEIPNLDAKTIYIKEYNDIKNYKIYDETNSNKINEVTGIYNEGDNSYIFGENREYNKESDGKRVLIEDNENKISKLFDEKILGITEAWNNVFILKEDKKVYKLGDSYDKLQEVDGGSNIVKIGAEYALDKDNNILKIKCNADDTYSYEKCNYEIEGKIEKIDTIDYNYKTCPFILYETGKAIVMTENNKYETLSNNAIDIVTNIEGAFVLEYNNVIYYRYSTGTISTTNISCITNKEEIPIKINNQGTILTNKGNCYDINIIEDDPVILEYKEEPTSTNIRKIGNYTYQDEERNIYYIKNVTKNYTSIKKAVQANKLINDIEVTKDERTLNEDKVIINIQVPSNKYTIKLPNGEISNNSNVSYEVKDNGIYTFEFTDETGYKSIRIVHVTNIQSRKETKVPEVTVIDGKIKLKSDEDIEYSLDGESWNEYSETLECVEPIYARIKSDNYECSTLKITLSKEGKLEVENTESRKVKGNILTGAVGKTQESIEDDNTKVIKFSKEVDKKKNSTSKNEKKGFFQYISDIADNIIYSFSSTDGRSAGCYFKDDITEVTYKNIDNDIISIQDNDINTITNNDSYIDYAIIANQYKTVSYSSIKDLTEITDDVIKKLANEEEAREESYNKSSDRVSVKLKELKYAYVDNKGNLESNIDIINKLKCTIGDKTKYTKIVGDGVTFYILTQEGEVYIVTESGNGTYNYFNDKFSLTKEMGSGNGQIPDKKYVDIVCQLDVNNIVDIYDSCTGLTKDGKVISLINDNEEDTSAVQELQEQTDKYLLASHLGLKDGKLYNFEDVQNGVEVLAGNIVKSATPGVGVYSENNKTIKMLSKDTLKRAVVPTLEEGEYFIDVEETNDELPKFVDIAEYKDDYLTRTNYLAVKQSGYSYLYTDCNYTNPDKYAMVYAITEDGEIWIYINGCVIDTGRNIDYFGPTANYSLSNTEWTNKDISLVLTANTTNKIKSIEINKGNEIVSTLNEEELGNKEIILSKSGNYNINTIDEKGRKNTTSLNVENIDKLAPYTPEIQRDTAQVIFRDDRDATDDYTKSGIKDRLISFDGINWTKVDGEIYKVDMTSDTITIFAKTIDKAGNESEVVSEKLEKGKETGKLIVKYQDINGNILNDDIVTTGYIGDNYKQERKNIDTYELVEVIGNEEGKYTKEDQIIIYKYRKIKDKTDIIDEDKKDDETKDNDTNDKDKKDDKTEDNNTNDEDKKDDKTEDNNTNSEEKNENRSLILPKTGQNRLLYIITITIIIVCIGSLIKIKYSEKNNK